MSNQQATVFIGVLWSMLTPFHRNITYLNSFWLRLSPLKMSSIMIWVKNFSMHIVRCGDLFSSWYLLITRWKSLQQAACSLGRLLISWMRPIQPILSLPKQAAYIPTFLHLNFLCLVESEWRSPSGNNISFININCLASSSIRCLLK